jgi:hypothetical protein
MLAVASNNSSEEVNQAGIFATSVERWRGKLSDADVFICQTICRMEMRHLGYTLVPIPADIGGVAWRIVTTPIFAWRALSANRSRRASTIPYLAKRISVFARR